LSIFYSIFLIFWFLIISIKFTYDRFWYKKYVGILLYKIGFKTQKILPKKKKKCIWIHATSFGETMSTKMLINKLSKKKDKYHIIFSAFTSDGYNLAKSFSGVDQVIILPIDLKYSIKKLIKNISPDIFILVESDYWLNLLQTVKQYGAKVILIGGRISDRSFKRFFRVKSFADKLFKNFDYLLLQDDSMKTKFINLGVDKNKIEVIGNLKLDTPYKKTQKTPLFLSEDKKYITFGSTHKGEEELLITSLKNLGREYCFILAPRRSGRFLEVEKLLVEMKVRWRFIHDQGKGDERIILVNRLGILEECYAKSELAIVGGSFVENEGGHNVFEPVRLGTPVLYGPHTFNQKSLTAIVENFGVGFSVTSDQIFSSVEAVLEKGRIPTETLKQIKASAEGSTAKAINLINSLL
jgi:3-deoxy-D-manno-octulosonic-acid transferase